MGDGVNGGHTEMQISGGAVRVRKPDNAGGYAMEKTLDSKAVVQINMAPFGVSHRLLQAVMREVGVVRLSEGEQEFAKNIVVRLISSPEVESILWECMGRCLYNGQKITKDTFESEQNRGDYLVVSKEVLEVNLIPFLSNLGSLLKTTLGKGINNLGLK